MRAGAEEKALDGSAGDPKLLHFIAIDRDGKQNNELYFVVPMPKSYEEYQVIAHGLMSNGRSCTNPDQLILNGLVTNAVSGDLVLAKLVPSAYPSYVNRPCEVEIRVGSW